MMPFTAWLVVHLRDLSVFIIAVSLVYHLLALWEGWKFAHRRPWPKPKTLSPVSVLKPLAHWDEETRDNVRSFCTQEYPRLQVVLGPKADVALQVREASPCPQDERLEVTTVICHDGLAVNPKINQVIQMWPHVHHDWIVLADQDMRVGPDYVQRVTAPLADPEVGLVTCFHAAWGAETLPALVEALLINTEYLPSMLVGRRLMGMRFAFGATLATRRDIIEGMGGFDALADYLADDFQMAQMALKLGHRVVLSDYIVESRLAPMSWRQMLTHQLRWARTNRACAPSGWFFSIITHLLFWTTVFWVLSGFSAASARLLFATMLFRGMETTYYNHVFQGIRPAWMGAWLAPVQDLVYFAVWLLSFRTDEVEWAGHRYEVLPDGTMRLVVPEGVAPQSP